MATWEPKKHIVHMGLHPLTCNTFNKKKYIWTQLCHEMEWLICVITINVAISKEYVPYKWLPGITEY